MLPDLAHRVRLPERMDDPHLDPAAHRHALGALARVNRVSATATRAWRRVRSLPGQGQLRVLDVGCGGGDVVIELAHRAARWGRALRLVGMDRSPVALDFARERAAGIGGGGVAVDFVRGDVGEGLPDGRWDLVLVNLFLHHLPPDAIVALLGAVREAGADLLAQDLVRSRAGYLLAWAGMRLLSRSRVGHVDGPLSVRAGFTPDELLGLALDAGLSGARVRRGWPERLILSWSSP